MGVLVVLSTASQYAFQGGGPARLPPSGRIYSGPLAGQLPPSVSTPWFHVGISMDVFVQALLALPIVIALSATALQRVPAGLLEQAEVCGASWMARGRLGFARRGPPCSRRSSSRWA